MKCMFCNKEAIGMVLHDKVANLPLSFAGVCQTHYTKYVILVSNKTKVESCALGGKNGNKPETQ